VNNIDLASVILNHKVLVESNQKYGFVKNWEIEDRDKDGFPELMVKFNRVAVQATVQPGENVTISITGEVLKDEIPVPFQGTNSIKVISTGK